MIVEILLAILITTQALVVLYTVEGLIKESEERIMSVISDFAAAQNVAFGRIGDQASRIEQGVQELKDKIVAGAISPADKATLDAQIATANELATRLEAVNVTAPAIPLVP